MAINVTVMNIGQLDDEINGITVAPGNTLVVDLEDVDVMKELRSDPDGSWLVLPDSAAGTLPPGGSSLLEWQSFPQFNYGFMFTGDGSVVASDLGTLDVVGDGVTDYLIKIEAPTVRYSPADPGVAQVRNLTIYITEDGVPTHASFISVPGVAALPYTESPVEVSFPVPAFAGPRSFGLAAIATEASDQAFIGGPAGSYALSLWARP